MNDEWLQWTRHNLERGCNPDEVRQILRNNGFPDAEIAAAMERPKDTFFGRLKESWRRRLQKAKEQLDRVEAERSGETPEPKSRIAQPGFDYKKMAQPRIARNSAARRVESDRIQLYVLDNFLSPQECDTVIAEINRNLRPSTITTGKDYSGFRTSTTCDLGLQQSKYIEKVDKKISRLLGIRLSWSEVMQGQKYEVGQEFKAHTDYFEPNTKEFEQFASDLGQRTWTFMVYLNDTPEGGQTRFNALDLEFQPKAGQALIWNNLYQTGEPNPDTIHHGMPVLEGQKLIITKWFRDKGKGTPYYSNNP